MARSPDLGAKGSRAARVGLPARVLLAVFASLAASLAVGTAAMVWEARRSVDAELTSAMASAAQAVRADLQEAQFAATGAEMTRTVRMFDGNRHIRASWDGAPPGVRAISQPFVPRTPPPAWFVRLIRPPAAVKRVGPIRLEPYPVNEIAEVWTGLSDALLVVGLLLVLSLVLIGKTTQRALAPLDAVNEVLARVGAGDFEARAPTGGVTEVQRLAGGVNAMVSQLDAFDRQNRRLHEQLATVHDEERAEIARELHDEIGPYLFAVNIDAAAVHDLAAAAQPAAIPARADLIQAAVAHMQIQVTDMLRRLRPSRAVEFGLGSAIEDLVAFWQARRPDIAFDLDLAIDDAVLSLGLREVLYRVAQEALSNAMRHGTPSRIGVGVVIALGEDAVLRIADNATSRARVGQRPHLGLMGMRERLVALGGDLDIDSGRGDGWTITARSPLSFPGPAPLPGGKEQLKPT